ELNKFSWIYRIQLKGNTNCQADIFYGQDIAIQTKSSVSSSEPYTVQYIDYKAFNDKHGYTLCARQNQGKAQLLQIGSLTPNVSYATDGFQFFGLSYKETGIPESMKKAHLDSEIYQYEFSYFALQSEIIHISPIEKSVVFYGLYLPQYDQVIAQPEEFILIDDQIKHSFAQTSKTKTSQLLNPLKQLNGLSIDENKAKQIYPIMDQVERNKHGLLSFFSANNHHIVLQQKELLVERPHGHIMIHGDLMHVSDDVMATTNFMFGVFNSHVVLGNTSFNKLLGDTRSPLNIQKISGQRIYLKYHGSYLLLGLPSYYDIGVATARWVYILDHDVITIDAIVDINHMQQSLYFTSEKGLLYDIIVTQQIVMGVNEYAYDLDLTVDGKTVKFMAPKESMINQKYPNLTYWMQSKTLFSILDEKTAFGCENQHGLLILSFNEQAVIKIDLTASINGISFVPKDLSYDDADEIGTTYFKSFAGNFHLKHPLYQQEVDKLELITFWYTHNALVHYASPHGLEQYNGGAWGTRDVCQGPLELFSATQHTNLEREIILKVYGRQFLETGDFPQWYMFDKYYQIQAHESHGDIIIWPMRSLAYYIKTTGDISILNESVPYMSKNNYQFTEPVNLMKHLEKQIEAIQSSFISCTHLPAYGGGDWDDTLQPANHDLTKKMVSGWTVALLYEAVKVLSDELSFFNIDFHITLEALAKQIKSDYEKYIMIDGIPAGFVVFDKEITYLLHPRDLKTGLKYRLLPFVRSMISEIAQNNQIDPYVNIINQYLKHPDGVRLMDTTVEYKGGQQTYFTRAETAANFGREIGLQYVHAHIRYIEAMSKIGHADEAYQGLFAINPILIEQTVPNAYCRQSNVYFSSSDAGFKNRYEAKENFHKIKKGEILVKGGWRLYSSGPGIYINQLITNILGIRLYQGNLMIDPILQNHLNVLSMNYEFNGK
ncbi:MAG: cellobiose phosphorylase, partial [Bacillota bacterium]